MSKEEKKAKKLAKKEEKQAKKQAKVDKANAKAQAKAEKKHAKAYGKFVKDTEKKNKKLQEKAASSGTDFVPIAIPEIDVFQTKKEIKAIKSGKKAYAKYVKKLDKKNAKLEKKCAKKGRPFVPIAVPTEEEFLNTAAAEKNKVGKITLAQAQEIAQTKMPDLNAASLESATEMIKGTARSMGIIVEE